MLELCLHDMNLNFDQTLNTCICIPKLIIQDIIIKKIEIVDIKSCLSPIWFNHFLASCKMSRYYVGKYTSPTAAVPLYQHLSEVIQLFKKEVEIPPPPPCSYVEIADVCFNFKVELRRKVLKNALKSHIQHFSNKLKIWPVL